MEKKRIRQFNLFDHRWIRVIAFSPNRRLTRAEFEEMFAERQGRLLKIKSLRERGIINVGQATYLNKFSADFSMEMRRSVREMLKEWGK